MHGYFHNFPSCVKTSQTPKPTIQDSKPTRVLTGATKTTGTNLCVFISTPANTWKSILGIRATGPHYVSSSSFSSHSSPHSSNGSSMSSCHSSSGSSAHCSSDGCFFSLAFLLSFSFAFASLSFFLFSPGAKGLQFEIDPKSKKWIQDLIHDSYSVHPWAFLISKSQTRFPSLHGGNCVVKVLDGSLWVHTSDILFTESGYSMQHGLGSCLDLLVIGGLHLINLVNGLLVEYSIFHSAIPNDIYWEFQISAQKCRTDLCFIKVSSPLGLGRTCGASASYLSRPPQKCFKRSEGYFHSLLWDTMKK